MDTQRGKSLPLGIYNREEVGKILGMSASKREQAVDRLLYALHGIAGWCVCQCAEKHGDNPNCPILIAENAINDINADSGEDRYEQA